MCLLPEKRVLDYLIRPFPDARLFGLPRAGNVQDLDLVVLDKSLKRDAWDVIRQRDVDAGLTVLLGKLDGPQGTATHSPGKCENNSAIRIPGIPFRSLEVAG